jgi:sialic acid synthase SpsE
MSETLQNYCDSRLEIIAEAGCNHCGDLEAALEIVRHARSCGADTIKFQSFIADKLINPGDIADFCKKSQFGYEEHCAIIEECEREQIKPLFSAFDIDSLEMLLVLGMDEVKVPSGQVFNQQLLKTAAMSMKKVYVSTGMCSMRNVRRAYDTLVENGCEPDEIVLMQCTTCYPAPHKDANLLVMDRYRKEFGTRIGYSDHTSGWSASVAAVALGATVIEKHFILHFKDDTPDACVSLNPVEFRMMVNHLHEAHVARGTSVKRPRECERKMFKRRNPTEATNDF